MRVITLLPSATEIVAALGCGDRLVGVTHDCGFPPFVRKLPRVTLTAVDPQAPAGVIDATVRELAAGGAPIFTLLERDIASLDPDLIVTQQLCEVCAVSETDVRALAARLPRPPAIVTLGGTTLEGIFADIARVGDALSVAETAAALVAALRARLRAVHDTLEAARVPRPRVALVEWTDPVFVGGHWVPEMIHRAGGVDVVARAGEHSREALAEELSAARPEVILVAPCGYDLERSAADARALLARDEWRWARELPAWALDANALTSRPAPRVVDGIEVMAAIFHPTLFASTELEARLAEAPSTRAACVSATPADANRSTLTARC